MKPIEPLDPEAGYFIKINELIKVINTLQDEVHYKTVSDDLGWLDKVLTKLENEVARDIQLRVTQNRSGKAPKQSHYEAKQTIASKLRQVETEDKSLLTEAMLRFYAGITGHTYESVMDEYLGRPLPGQDKYYVDNKLFTYVSTAAAWYQASRIERATLTPKDNGGKSDAHS